MAICPFAVKQILPENNTQNRIIPTTVICHRAVSSAQTLYGYWNSPGVELESHFYVGPDGTIYQYMDTNVRADANVQANAFAVSIETWDGGNTPDSMGWSPVQVAALKRLIAWICDTHGIIKAPAQTWNGGGIGGHNWFPIPWADGPRGCPGTARNAQLRNDIIPAVASGRVDDMAVTDVIGKRPDGSNITVGDALVNLYLGAFYRDGQDGGVYGDVHWMKNTLANTPDGGQLSLADFRQLLKDTLLEVADKVDQIAVGGVDYDRLADTILARLDVDLVRRTSS